MTLMTGAIVFDDALAGDILRPDHPLKPARARALVDLLATFGWLDGERLRLVRPVPASRQDVLRVHDAAYVQAVERLSAPDLGSGGVEAVAARFGLSAHGDTPAFAGMFPYYLLSCGAAIEAARLVDSGTVPFAFSPAGGVNHHAMPGHASGFGVFNDAAVAIAWLRAQGRRVMYLDLDVHHGDGVEAAFERDPDVLTVSIHESTRTLFPGPRGGFAENTGSGAGEGFAVNVPLAPYTDDETWLWAFDAVVPPLYAAFAPDLLLVQLGADAYYRDPLAHLHLTSRAFMSAAARLRAMTGGRLVAFGGGGYDVEATPRIWALEVAALAGLPLDPSDVGLGDDQAPALDANSARQLRQFAERSVAVITERVFPVVGAVPPRDE